MAVNLDVIRELLASRDFLGSWPGGDGAREEVLVSLADEVPGLVAEVERLRAERDALHRYAVLWSAQVHNGRLPPAERDDVAAPATAQEMKAIEGGLDPVVFDWLVLMEAVLESANPLRAEQDDGWFRDGKEAAIQELETGTKPKNPHAKGSPAARWWSRGYSYNWRQFNALRAARERDAAEGKVLPKGWRVTDGGYERDVADRDDLIYVRVRRGTASASTHRRCTWTGSFGKDGTWLRPDALILPVDGARRGKLSTQVEAHRVEADTVLAAIEAAEAWLKGNPG